MSVKICSDCSGIGAVCIVGTVAIGTAAGVGILCGYGLKKIFQHAPPQMNPWPQHVQRRIKTTFMYLGGSMALAVGSGVLALQSAYVADLLHYESYWIDVVFGASIGWCFIVCTDSPYNPYFLNQKHLSWALGCGIAGLSLARFTQGGPSVLVMAGLCTAVHVGAYAANAVLNAYLWPNKIFLTWRRSLRIGLGIVSVSLIATVVVADSYSNPFVAILFPITWAGYLALSSAYVLRHTQKIIARAEATPIGAPFDPIHRQIYLLIDAYWISLWFIPLFEAIKSHYFK